MKSHLLVIVLIQPVLFACNAKSSERGPDSQNPKDPVKIVTKQYPKTSKEEELSKFPDIQQILRSNPCINSDDCNEVEVESGVAPLKNEQILILEDIKLPEEAFYRYQDRISGFYKLDDSGTYRQKFPKAKISKPVFDIVKRLNRESGQISRKIPSLGLYLYQHSQLKITDDNFGEMPHSDYVFGMAVDRNPDANFVFADNPNLTREELCSLLTDEEDAYLRINSRFTSALYGLNEIIVKNRIKYINMSFISTPQSLERHMRNFCRHSNREVAEQAVKYYNSLYLKLLEMNPDIVLVQAVPNDNDSEYECPFHRRWIRVGYTARIRSTIPPAGENLTKNGLPENLKPVFSCVSTAMNGGVTDSNEPSFGISFPKDFDENSLYYNYWGLAAYPVERMATSWATPLALSYLRANSQGKDPDSIYLTVINKILDPIKNKQFIENK